MRTAPGRFCYALAALLALAGVALCAALLLKFVAGLTDTRQFLAPGRLAFTADAPGRYVLWHDYRTVFAGRNYAVPEALPDGARISIIESASGRSLDVRASSGMRSTTGSAERVAVAAFRIADAGQYEAVVEGDFAPRVMSVGHNLFPRVLFELGGAIASLLLGLGGGGALAAWAWFGREAAARAALSNEQGGIMQENEGAGAARADTAAEHSARQLATLVYALQAASFLVGVTFIAAVVVNYVKRDEIAGTWIESHFLWQIRTFWYCLLWSATGLALAVVVVGFFIMGATAIWLIYRIVKGWLRLSEGKPMYA